MKPKINWKKRFEWFLKNGDLSSFDRDDKEIFRLVIEGKTIDDIKKILSIDKTLVIQKINRMKYLFYRLAEKKDRERKVQSLIINLKASKKPLSFSEIPVEDFFSPRVNNALANAKVKTLGGIIKRGRSKLLLNGRIRDIGLNPIEKILRQFGVKLPD